MARLEVLVVGAGIAGSVQAYWLSRGGAQVTVIERSPTKTHSGQGLDVEGTGRVIARRMGVVEEMRARATGETGVTLVNNENQDIATVGGGPWITQEIEILRSDLADVLTEAAKNVGATFHYGRTITAISQTKHKVNVTFNDDTKAEYDALIGADGLRSRTRAMIIEPGDYVKALDVYVAFYRIACLDSDNKNGRLQHAIGGRSMLVRPARNNFMSAFLNMVAKSDVMEKAVGQDRATQKAALKELFADVGGLAPRLLAALDDTDDFYFERISQIKLPTWSNGRCTLVGDAGYAPSPLTGQGTRLALIGAYVCAGELLQNPDDPAAAFREYERKCRENVEQSQKIPLFGQAPKIANPQSVWGIWLLRTIFSIVAWTGVWRLFSGQDEDSFKLPDYPQMYDATKDN